MKTRVKICCIASKEEAQLAVSFGASALGLVAAMPSGPGPIPDRLIWSIARTVPPPVATFLLTCETQAGAIVVHHMRTQTSALQLVDAPEAEAVDAIRLVLPAVKIVRVVQSTARARSLRRSRPRRKPTPCCWTAAIPAWRSRNWAAPAAYTIGASAAASSSNRPCPSSSPAV